MTNGDYLKFIESGAYSDFNLWLDEGWSWLQENNINSPLYWHNIDGEWQHFTLKGLQKVNLLNEYIAVILGYSKEPERIEEVNEAIAEAIKLFISDMSQVAVSGATTTRYFSVRDYLDRIRNYSYGKVDIMWTEIGYVSQLKKGTVGNYYGVITVTQQFVGYGQDNETPIYIDQTEKDIEIVLKTFTINKQGRVEVDCEVLLNDIGVKDIRTYP